MSHISIEYLHQEAHQILQGQAEGEGLDGLAEALIQLAVVVSVTTLSSPHISIAINNAFHAGATLDQVQEIITLVSALGVHSLMIASGPLLAIASQHKLIDITEAFDAHRQSLWDEYVGEKPYWKSFSSEMPGFLESLLRISPETFAGFFTYCSIPWRNATVSPHIKELAAMACDATPSHRFLPGFRVHLKNAIALGIGSRALLQTLKIAEGAPEHRGAA